MPDGTITAETLKWRELANNLGDVLYFDPNRMATGETLYVVGSLLEASQLEQMGLSAAFFELERLGEAGRCRPVFEQMRFVCVMLYDEKARELVSATIARHWPALPQLVLPQEAFEGYESFYDLLCTGGEKAFEKAMLALREKPVAGLLDLADVKAPKRAKSTLSGIDELDRTIGGFYPGELSLWTGDNGSGKSTLASMVLLEALEQEKHVFAYSGELPAWRYKQWAMLQTAGPGNLVHQTSPHSGKDYYNVPPEAAKKIEEWFRGKYFIYDNNIAAANNEDSIVGIMELAARRHSCTTFLVDNLMTVRFQSKSDDNFFRAQSMFAGRLMDFAKKYNVHVHLVAHQKKVGGKDAGKEAVSGSKDLTNRPDNVFCVWRLDPDAAEKKGFDAGLDLLKNRQFGAVAKIQLNFDPASRRYYRDEAARCKRYSWERAN